MDAAFSFFSRLPVPIKQLEATATAVRDYLKEVFRLAPLVGIDPAIVVAQAFLETGNFGAIPGAGATAWLERRNPGSIGVTSTGKPGEADIDAGHSWANGTDAARGQILHLAAYVFGSLDPDEYAVLGPYDGLDPRWSAVFNAGYDNTVRLLSDLGNGKWAADPDYAQKIADRGNAIFGFKEQPSMTTPAKRNMTPGLIKRPTELQRIATGKVENVGMNRIGRRKIRGTCWHRGLTGTASLEGAVSWLLAPTTAGLTDGYLDHRDGRTARMIPRPGQDPRGDMTPWAQGPWSWPASTPDAQAFVKRYINEFTGTVDVWNGFLESWEITGDYFTPISDATKRSMVLITAANSHDAGCHWEDFPYLPDGTNTLFSHREGCGVAYKACAGEVVWSYINSAAFIDACKERMKAAQFGTTAPPIESKPLPPETTYAPVVKPRYLGDLSKPIIKDGKTTLYLVTDQYRAIRPTGRFQRASRTAARVGPDMKAGEDANINFVFEAEDGNPWGLSAWGTRFFLNDFERVSDVPAKA